MCWDETNPDYILLAPIPLQYSTTSPSTTIIEENTIIVEHFLHIISYHISWHVMSKRRKYKDHHHTGCMESWQVKKLVNLSLNVFTSFVIIAFFDQIVFFLMSKKEKLLHQDIQKQTLASPFYFGSLVLRFTSQGWTFHPYFVVNKHSSTPSNQSEVFPEFSDWRFLRWA